MATDEFYDDEDAYRQRILDDFDPNGGIAGPQESGVGYPAAAPTTKPYDFESFRSDWLSRGFGSKTDANQLAEFAKPYGVTIKGGDAAYDPNGKWIADLIGDVGGRNTLQFLQGGGTAAKKPATTGAGGASGVGGAGGGSASSGFLSQIRKLITDRLGAMSAAPSMDDPVLAAQSQAYSRARGRGAEEERAAMAERAAQQGLIQGGQSSGAFDTELRSIKENAGEDIAGNDAQLMGAEVQQRRAEVQQLLNMALASGDAESARELQSALANLDAQLRRESMKLQNSQFGQQMGYNYANLGQQNAQYNDQMGFNTWRANEDDIYRNSVLGAFGGG